MYDEDCSHGTRVTPGTSLQRARLSEGIDAGEVSLCVLLNE